MVENRPPRSPEGNESKGTNEEIKGESSKPKRYRGKKKRTKTQGPYIKADTDFKGWCSELEVYVFDIGLRALHKLSRTMNELEWYMGAMYINICQPETMTKTQATLTDPYIPTIMTDTDSENDQAKKKNTDEAICKK